LVLQGVGGGRSSERPVKVDEHKVVLEVAKYGTRPSRFNKAQRQVGRDATASARPWEGGSIKCFEDYNYMRA
jgi:hypothetical protein